MTAACLLIMILSSDVYTDFYEQGNTAYRAGEYADAIRSYEQLAASGVWNEEVYFNGKLTKKAASKNYMRNCMMMRGEVTYLPKYYIIFATRKELFFYCMHYSKGTSGLIL